MTGCFGKGRGFRSSRSSFMITERRKIRHATCSHATRDTLVIMQLHGEELLAYALIPR